MTIAAKLAVGSGAVLVSLFAGVGVASAQPDVEAIVNSSCNYSQVVAALNDQSPAVASEITTNPMANSWLQQLVASAPAQRRVMVSQVQGIPAVQEYTSLINSVASSCARY